MTGVTFHFRFHIKMARFGPKTENLYDQLADIYEAASVVGVSRHFTRYDRLVHDSGNKTVVSIDLFLYHFVRFHTMEYIR